MSYVTLMGAEDVQRAGRQMQSAADDMKRAAESIGYHMEMHHRFMDDWLQRFEAALVASPPESEGGE